ncbi:MAG: hypothetical protein AAF938_20545, partial [Myxococcota bacterium]
IFAATGVVLAAIYMLHAVYKMFWGPVENDANKELADVSWREWASLSPLLVLIFAIGFFPGAFLAKSQPAIDGFIADFSTKWQQSTQNDDLRVIGGPAEEAEPEGEAVAAVAPEPSARPSAPPAAQPRRPSTPTQEAAAAAVRRALPSLAPSAAARVRGNIARRSPNAPEAVRAGAEQ